MYEVHVPYIESCRDDLVSNVKISWSLIFLVPRLIKKRSYSPQTKNSECQILKLFLRKLQNELKFTVIQRQSQSKYFILKVHSLLIFNDITHKYKRVKMSKIPHEGPVC